MNAPPEWYAPAAGFEVRVLTDGVVEVRMGSQSQGQGHETVFAQVVAERLMVELADKAGEGVSPAALKYVNRLSDFLFVAGRFANDNGARDVLWAPGQNR